MKHLKYAFIIISISALVLIGCGANPDDSANSDASAEIDPHAGHDHAPGEGHEDEPTVLLADGELDWCAEHEVPESVCTQCNPSLIASFKESGDWCGGHGIPESHCRLCNDWIKFPQEEILAQRKAAAMESDIEVSLYFRPNTEVCATNDALIQFASTRTAEKAGLSFETVREAQYENIISAPAETVFDEGSSVYVTSTVTAMVSKWLKSPGDIVEKGDKLAIVRSPEIAQLKSSLISKHANYEVQRKELERQTKMREKDLNTQVDYDLQLALTEQARAEMSSVEGLLLSAGLRLEDVKSVKENGTIDYNFELTAPASGILVERIAQLGELLDAGKTFAVLADPQAMWIDAELTEAQLREVVNGQKLVFSSDGMGLNGVGGEIIWISRLLDPHSRTGTVRAKVLNPRHRLQANEFGRVTIPVLEEHEITLVPKNAVQWEGCCNVVFVKESDQRFRPRKVELLDGEGPYYQVASGLNKGEEVVVSGAFLLKTELKKTSIGAGCCGIEPAG